MCQQQFGGSPKTQPPFKLIKRAPSSLSALQCQNLLAKQYHFLKWELVDLIDIEQREMQLKVINLQAAWCLRDIEDSIKSLTLGVTNKSIEALKAAVASLYIPGDKPKLEWDPAAQEQPRMEAAKSQLNTLLDSVQLSQDIQAKLVFLNKNRQTFTLSDLVSY